MNAQENHVSDLVTHLREIACNGHPIGDDAADEIERLEARVEKLEKALGKQGSESCANCDNISKGDTQGTCLVCGSVWEELTVPSFAGETNVETVAGSPYRSAYSFRVF